MQGLLLYIYDWFLVEMTNISNSQNMKKRFPLMFKTTTVMLHINQNKFVLFKNFAKLPICVKLLFNKSPLSHGIWLFTPKNHRLSICITPSNISYKASLQKELLVRAGTNKTSTYPHCNVLTRLWCNLKKAVHQVYITAVPSILSCYEYSRYMYCRRSLDPPLLRVHVLCQGQTSDCVITWCLPLFCPKLFEKFCCTLVSNSCFL